MAQNLPEGRLHKDSWTHGLHELRRRLHQDKRQGRPDSISAARSDNLTIEQPAMPEPASAHTTGAHLYHRAGDMSIGSSPSIEQSYEHLEICGDSIIE